MTRATKNRSYEPLEKTRERRKLDNDRANRNRSLESPVKRRKLEHDRAITNRSIKSPETTRKRRKLDCERAIKNRTLESPETTLKRLKLESERTAFRRSNVSIDNAIQLFLNKTKRGPDFVCVSCHRLMYRQNVISLYRFLRVSTQRQKRPC